MHPMHLQVEVEVAMPALVLAMPAEVMLAEVMLAEVMAAVVTAVVVAASISLAA